MTDKKDKREGEAIRSRKEEKAKKATPHKRRSSLAYSGPLATKAREGFVLRWVKDELDRVKRLIEDLAYEHVTDEKGENIYRDSYDLRGKQVRMYLMQTPKELYEEGMAEKEKRNVELDPEVTGDFYGDIKKTVEK